MSIQWDILGRRLRMCILASGWQVRAGFMMASWDAIVFLGDRNVKHHNTKGKLIGSSDMDELSL